jgi:hypothetical protein
MVFDFFSNFYFIHMCIQCLGHFHFDFEKNFFIASKSPVTLTKYLG